MHIVYSDGSSREGLILALSGHELRVAIQGADDPVQFNLKGDSWLSEDGRKAVFEFPLGLTGTQAFLTAIREVTVEGLSAPRACESGGECLLKRISAAPDTTN